MSIDTKKIRSQLYMLERATRALRVHLDEQQEVQGQTGWATLQKPLDTGLSKLLGSCNDIEPSTPKPYEQFYPKLWLGFPGNREGFSVEVKSRCYPPLDESSFRTDVGSSCLVLTVDNQSEATDLWLNVETELDLSAITAGHGLEVNFILSFINSTPYPLGPIWAQLGVTVKGKHNPQFWKSLPALDVPIEMSYKLSAKQLLSLPKQEMEKLNFTLALPIPVSGSYTAVLSYFEVAINQRAPVLDTSSID